MPVSRRSFLQASAAGSLALATPALVAAESTRVLRFVPSSDAPSLDPVWSVAWPTRNHALMVFDTLYGLNSQFGAEPQMVAGHSIENDGKLWRLTLRPGLIFHDGNPVLARDCVASIKRWGQRDTFGQTLLAYTEELTAPDDKTIVFRLKKTFPLLPQALGKTSANWLAIMPERLAQTDAFTQVTEMVGSGPYRFLASERVSGARLAYARFDKYVPRTTGQASFTDGPRIAHFDRVEWQVIPDPATATAALQTGAVDWIDQPLIDLVGVLRADAKLTVKVNDPTGLIATLRFNQLHPPFDNPAIRRVVLGAISQSDCMDAVGGAEPELIQTGIGFFPPASPFVSDVGMSAFGSLSDTAKAKQSLAAAGYKGERMVLLAPADVPRTNGLCQVLAQTLKQIGMNVDLVMTDWASLLGRATNRGPVDQGGWSAYCIYWAGLEQISPGVHAFLRGNGAQAPLGWPTSPEIEHLRNAWFDADPVAQKSIAADIQRQAFQDVPYVPLGELRQPTAFSKTLTGMLPGFAQFTTITRG